MVGLIAGILIITISLGFPLTPAEERQLLRDIAEIKATLKTFMEQVDKRFEQVNRELDRLVNIIVGVFAGQIALVGAVIGFAWWDRRTVIRKACDLLIMSW